MRFVRLARLPSRTTHSAECMSAECIEPLTGLYTLKTSIRHKKFMDLAWETKINIIASFEVGGATKTSLGSLRDIEIVKTQLRLQIQSSIHPGISV